MSGTAESGKKALLEELTFRLDWHETLVKPDYIVVGGGLPRKWF